jgi:hypothetical protein
MQMIDLSLMTAREGVGQRQPAWTAVKRVTGTLSGEPAITYTDAGTQRAHTLAHSRT